MLDLKELNVGCLRDVDLYSKNSRKLLKCFNQGNEICVSNTLLLLEFG